MTVAVEPALLNANLWKRANRLPEGRELRRSTEARRDWIVRGEDSPVLSASRVVVLQSSFIKQDARAVTKILTDPIDGSSPEKSVSKTPLDFAPAISGPSAAPRGGLTCRRTDASWSCGSCKERDIGIIRTATITKEIESRSSVGNQVNRADVQSRTRAAQVSRSCFAAFNGEGILDVNRCWHWRCYSRRLFQSIKLRAFVPSAFQVLDPLSLSSFEGCGWCCRLGGASRLRHRGCRSLGECLV